MSNPMQATMGAMTYTELQAKLVNLLLSNILEALENHEKSIFAQNIKKSIDERGVNGVLVRPFSSDSIDKINYAMTNAKPPINFFMFTNNQCTFPPNKDKILVFLPEDVDRVEAIMNKIEPLTEKDYGEISANAFFDKADNKIIMQFDNVPKFQRDALSFETAKRGIQFACSTKDGVNSIVVSGGPNVKAAFHEALGAAITNTTGSGSIFFQNHSPEVVNPMIQLLKNHKESYVIAADDPRKKIIISDKGFAMYDNDLLTDKVSIHDADIEKKLYTSIKTMGQPYIATKEELSESADTLSQRAIVRNSELSKINQKENEHRADLEYRAKVLLEMKFSLDNGNMPEHPVDIYNPNVPFLTFFEDEIVNDTHDIEESQYYKDMMKNASPEKQQRINNCIKDLKESTLEERQYTYNFAKNVCLEVSAFEANKSFIRDEHNLSNEEDIIEEHESLDNFVSPEEREGVWDIATDDLNKDGIPDSESRSTPDAYEYE